MKMIQNFIFKIYYSYIILIVTLNKNVTFNQIYMQLFLLLYLRKFEIIFYNKFTFANVISLVWKK